MSDEIIKYNIPQMESDYLSAKRSIWNAWIEVRRRELSQEHGIMFEQEVLRFADDIESRRKMPSDEMVEKCIKEISEAK